MSEGLSRHPIYYQIVGYGLYLVGGVALFFNGTCTYIAYLDGNLPWPLAWFFACLFAAISIGVGLFLGSPSTWGELWGAFISSARGAGSGGEGRAPVMVTALLLAVVISCLIAFFAFVYAADWYSTWDFLTGWQIRGMYLFSACLALIVGPETCFILANAVLRQGRRITISHLREAMVTEPQLAYLKEVRKGRVSMARDAGMRDSGQYQHR